MRGTFAQHPPPQRAGARHRGPVDHAPAERRADDDLRRRRSGTATRACRWSSWPGRSTGRAAPATGRPRGPRCSASGSSIAESFERIHRINLVGMGVLPLQFREGESAASLGLTGDGALHDPRAGRRDHAAPGRHRGGRPARRVDRRFTALVAHRRAGRGRLLPARRHPAAWCCGRCSRPPRPRRRAEAPGSLARRAGSSLSRRAQA